MKKYNILAFSARKMVLLMVFIISAGLILFGVIQYAKDFFTVSEGVFPSFFSEQAIPLTSNITPPNGGKLAIIIDDFGSSRDGVKEMMGIKEHLTFAVMPFLEYSTKDAEDGFANGFEIIVHLSMEPEKGKISWLGPRPILVGTAPSDIKRIVKDSFDSVPHAFGANIHMGSKASSRESVMTSVFEVIKENNLYFVDSLTSRSPASRKLSGIYKIPCYERNIFLDGNRSVGYVNKQLEKAQRYALKNGTAVAIGHVGMEGGKTTATAILEMLPEFKKNNIELVFISELGK